MSRITTVTNTAKDSDFVPNYLTVNKIDQITFVVAVNAEISGGIADGTGFEFRFNLGREKIKERF